jgi:hypothetical protein
MGSVGAPNRYPEPDSLCGDRLASNFADGDFKIVPPRVRQKRRQ